MKHIEQRIKPVDFAVIKEYLRVGGNYKGISEVAGLSMSQVKEIDKTRYYKDYQKLQDKRIIGELLNDGVPIDDKQQIPF